jgi:hypothetical protein
MAILMFLKWLDSLFSLILSNPPLAIISRLEILLHLMNMREEKKRLSQILKIKPISQLLLAQKTREL